MYPIAGCLKSHASSQRGRAGIAIVEILGQLAEKALEVLWEITKSIIADLCLRGAARFFKHKGPVLRRLLSLPVRAPLTYFAETLRSVNLACLFWNPDEAVTCAIASEFVEGEDLAVDVRNTRIGLLRSRTLAGCMHARAFREKIRFLMRIPATPFLPGAWDAIHLPTPSVYAFVMTMARTAYSSSRRCFAALFDRGFGRSSGRGEAIAAAELFCLHGPK